MKKYSKSFVVAAVLCCVLIFTCANAFAQDITINENIENSEIRPYDFLLGMTTVLVDNTPLRSSKTDNSTDLGPIFIMIIAMKYGQMYTQQDWGSMDIYV